MTDFLTIDAGNSHLTLGVYRNSELVRSQRIHTRPFRAAPQLARELADLLSSLGMVPSATHLAISSVVPDYNGLLEEAGAALGPASFHWVSAKSPHGFTMADSVRREIGADLVAGLVGARGKFQGPLVVVDAGTATTLALLSGSDHVVGVAILPGIKTQIKTLMEKAPHLADAIKVEIPPNPFGTNTVESIQSGIMYGHAHMIEGFIQRYRALDGFENARVFGCGGLFTTIAPICPGVDHLEAHLVNEGCLILGQRSAAGGVLRAVETQPAPKP